MRYIYLGVFALLGAAITLIAFNYLSTCENTSIDPQQRYGLRVNSFESVDIYYLARTGEYSYGIEEFKNKSAVRIYRECGLNCGKFLSGVFDHLSNAVPLTCLYGQQDTIIEFGDNQRIIYSYSGRHILYKDKCYFNDVGINQVLESPGFIF